MVTSDRLRFRPYTEKDLDFYARLWGDPKVVRYIGKGETKTFAEAEVSLKRWFSEYEHGFGLQALELKPDNKLIGHAGLVRQTIEGQEEIEVGYWLLPEYWGMGLAKEAAITLRNVGFKEKGLMKLIALINPNHPASIFVAKKAGLSYEKTVKLAEGDTLVYSIMNR
ncbi:GNAT family N-acetyltransferase [Oceanobacillus manasiensis]|uniref:GNAT family N-acetyltransferase n=1 Tax=Oceanobacillus manasiensis TaxID=586413 RepID=UPI0005AB2F11|nr:GNAT family N-acetyltransferase [Oceanobacillus manasiensis]